MTEFNNIREKLAKFLANEISLPDFEDWFVQQTWGVQKDDNKELRQVIHAIELRLSEFSSEHMDEQGLRKELASFVEHGTHLAGENLLPVQELKGARTLLDTSVVVKISWQKIDNPGADCIEFKGIPRAEDTVAVQGQSRMAEYERPFGSSNSPV